MKSGILNPLRVGGQAHLIGAQAAEALSEINPGVVEKHHPRIAGTRGLTSSERGGSWTSVLLSGLGSFGFDPLS